MARKDLIDSMSPLLIIATSGSQLNSSLMLFGRWMDISDYLFVGVSIGIVLVLSVVER